MLSKFSKYYNTSSSKLFMKRRHCIFNTIVKESALKKHFIFHFCICLRSFVAAFDTICAFQSSVKLYHRHPSLKANKILYIYLSCKLRVPDWFQHIIVFKLWHLVPLPSLDCRDSLMEIIRYICIRSFASPFKFSIANEILQLWWYFALFF